MNVEALVSRLKAGWKALSGLVALVISIMGNFLASPPTLWREAGEASNISRLVVIIIVSAVLSAALTGKMLSRRVTFYLFAPLAILFFLVYSFMRAKFSCPYSDGRVATGWLYLSGAREYLAKNPGQGCELLIADFIGDTDKIWPTIQIGIVWAVLLTTYIATVSLVATILVRSLHHVSNPESKN
jgi:hypothetical protein